MSIKTTFFEQERVKKDLFDVIYKFDSIYEKIDYALSENLYPMHKDSYHFIGNLLKRTNSTSRLEIAFANQIFNAIYRAEITSAGSANIGYSFAIELSKMILKSGLSEKNETVANKLFDNLMETMAAVISDNTKICSKNDLRKTINLCCQNELLRDVIWEAINLAGLEGKIFIENGRQSTYTIELKEGYSFNLNPFKWMLTNGPWERREVKVLIVDGMIEKVSELEHLLTKAFDTKQSLVIFAMGFSEEVGMTLKTNLDRGLLDVQPVRIPSDLDSLNVVNDIAVVCGTQPVSALKGELVTFKKWEELPTIEKIKINEIQTTIENSKTRGAVSTQIRSLLEKRNENHLYEDIQNLIDKRMKSLVSNAAIIYLPDAPPSELDNQRIQIDLALRQIKTVLNFGTVNLEKVLEQLKPENAFEKMILEAIAKINMSNKQIPTLSLLMAIKLVGKAVMMFFIASGFVAITS